MSQSPKARLLPKIISVLKKRYTPPGRRESMSILENLIMSILADGTTTDRADAVFKRLKENYFDWNEVRVSALVELQDQLSDLPNPEQCATRLKSALKFVFETTYGFDLEPLKKIPMKDVALKFEKMPHVSEYVVNRLIRDGLGGTAMPLDSAAVRILQRLGLIDEKNTAHILSASLARQIPRSASFEFCHVLSELGAEFCVESEPKCPDCCLLPQCSTGERRIAEIAAAKAAARVERRARDKSKKIRSRSKAR